MLLGLVAAEKARSNEEENKQEVNKNGKRTKTQSESSLALTGRLTCVFSCLGGGSGVVRLRARKAGTKVR